MKLKGKSTNIWSQLIKFNFVGLVNTFIDYIVFILLHTVGLSMLTAQIISYSCGMMNSYIMNKRWTFGVQASLGKLAFLKFIIWNVIVLAISYMLLLFFVQVIELPVIWAKCLATVLVALINYVGSKKFVFV